MSTQSNHCRSYISNFRHQRLVLAPSHSDSYPLSRDSVPQSVRTMQGPCYIQQHSTPPPTAPHLILQHPTNTLPSNLYLPHPHPFLISIPYLRHNSPFSSQGQPSVYTGLHIEHQCPKQPFPFLLETLGSSDGDSVPSAQFRAFLFLCTMQATFPMFDARAGYHTLPPIPPFRGMV